MKSLLCGQRVSVLRVLPNRERFRSGYLTAFYRILSFPTPSCTWFNLQGKYLAFIGDKEIRSWKVKTAYYKAFPERQPRLDRVPALGYQLSVKLSHGFHLRAAPLGEGACHQITQLLPGDQKAPLTATPRLYLMQLCRQAVLTAPGPCFLLNLFLKHNLSDFEKGIIRLLWLPRCKPSHHTVPAMWPILLQDGD